MRERRVVLSNEMNEVPGSRLEKTVSQSCVDYRLTPPTSITVTILYNY